MTPPFGSRFVGPELFGTTSQLSGDSWMYPYQRTPSWEIPILALYHVGIYGFFHPQEPPRLNTIFIPWGPHVRERGTPNRLSLETQAHNAQDWQGWTALHASAAHGRKVRHR